MEALLCLDDHAAIHYLQMDSNHHLALQYLNNNDAPPPLDPHVDVGIRDRGARNHWPTMGPSIT